MKKLLSLRSSVRQMVGQKKVVISFFWNFPEMEDEIDSLQNFFVSDESILLVTPTVGVYSLIYMHKATVTIHCNKKGTHIPVVLNGQLWVEARPNTQYQMILKKAKVEVGGRPIISGILETTIGTLKVRSTN